MLKDFKETSHVLDGHLKAWSSSTNAVNTLENFPPRRI